MRMPAFFLQDGNQTTEVTESTEEYQNNKVAVSMPPWPLWLLW